MHKLDNVGSLLIPMVLTGTLLMFSLVFGFWAFAGRQDYKNNVDSKISDAVKEAETQLTLEKDAEFAERDKSPYRTYQGSSTFGTLNFAYPRTWSVYVDERGAGSTPIKGYMHPNVVRYDQQGSVYALRFEVVESPYEQVLRAYDGSRKSGKVTIEAYRAPKVESQLGSRVKGEIFTKKQGDLVLLPIRDKTIKIWTEGSEYTADFASILETVTFVP